MPVRLAHFFQTPDRPEEALESEDHDGFRSRRALVEM